ncbi:MAG: polysaccharide deacetylase family protein [Winogradskyella sp.]|uniref:polysaccharide deacetylase family protein n=1 Tax=Winogradskyella sp. TaxID=1883156 RepID=UPI0017E42146|nr:polysaccharide deacetylase family protein [Winogradskyella sp.]
MQIIPAKTPGFVKSLFPNLVWSVNTGKKELYLTFDDGPIPEITEWVLQQLKNYNAKATFFCIGRNIEKHQQIFKSIVNNGHSVGNHTYNHLKGWKTATDLYIEDTIKTQKLLYPDIKMLFRPPYGKFKVSQSKQLQKLGYKIILWDVLSYDWDSSVSKKMCYNNVVDAAKPGSIIVFHDSIKANKNLTYTLPKILEYYSKRGYSFKGL